MIKYKITIAIFILALYPENSSRLSMHDEVNINLDWSSPIHSHIWGEEGGEGLSSLETDTFGKKYTFGEP